MNSGELYTLFRENVLDTELPYFWGKAEIYRYMDDAYKMFVRLTGGIADFTSDATQVAVTAGEGVTDLHPSLLRVTQAFRASDLREVKVINNTDLPALLSDTKDFGQVHKLMFSKEPGTPQYILIGAQRGKAQILPIPLQNDTITLSVYRLPFDDVVDETHLLDEVQDFHHLHLLDWMKHLAYKKQDAETFNQEKADTFEQSFRNYCTQVKAEWERYKHKTRVVKYGGLP